MTKPEQETVEDRGEQFATTVSHLAAKARLTSQEVCSALLAVSITAAGGAGITEDNFVAIARSTFRHLRKAGKIRG